MSSVRLFTRKESQSSSSFEKAFQNFGTSAGIASFVGITVIDPKSVTKVAKDHPAATEGTALVSLLWLLALKNARVRALVTKRLRGAYLKTLGAKITLPGYSVFLLLAVGYLVCKISGGQPVGSEAAPLIEKRPVEPENLQIPFMAPSTLGVPFGLQSTNLTVTEASFVKAASLSKVQRQNSAKPKVARHAGQASTITVHHAKHHVRKRQLRRQA